MTPEKIQRLSGILNQLEREETQLGGFVDFAAIKAESHFEITGEEPYDGGSRCRSSYSMRFSLDAEETALIMLALQAIYEQRVKKVKQQLADEGVETTDAA